MARVKEKIAYVKGLLEGSDLFGKDPQARTVLEKLLEIFDEVADALEEVQGSQEEMEEYLEAIDSDLSEVEDEIYGDEDGAGGKETDFVEMECPNCQETVYFEHEFLNDDVEVSCPECGHVIYLGEAREGPGAGERGEDAPRD